MMAYVGTDSVDNTTVLPDFASGLIFLMKSGAGALGKLQQFNLFPLGNEIKFSDAASLGIFEIFNSSGAAAALSPGGNLVFISTNGNSAQLGQVKGSDLTLVSTFGVASSSTLPSSPARILVPYSMNPLQDGASQFVASGALFDTFSTGEICVLTMPGFVNARIGATDEPLAVIGGGPTGPGGHVFVLGKNTNVQYGTPQTSPVGLYTLSPSALTKLGTLSPAQVDATWSHFIGADGIAYDQVDGNPIIIVSTSDAVANQTYFVKLAASNAAVIWTCPVDFFFNLDNNLGRAQITRQVLYYMSAGGRLYTIDTSTGASVNSVLGSWAQAGGQLSEDISGSIIMNGAWTETSTHPLYIGSYMGTGGQHSLSGQWARFFPDGLPSRKFLAFSGPVDLSS
jgi:hypothetical protein